MNGPEPILSDYTFELPPELIAQAPLPDRRDARLMLVGRRASTREDHRVADLPTLLRGDELLVFNDTRVVPARLHGHKPTGGKVELLALEPDPSGRTFIAMGRSSKGFSVGTPIHLDDDGPILYIDEVLPDGHLRVRLPSDVPDLWALCEAHGEVPLPPYVERAPTAADRERYQTVFADKPGAVAAPTAGLHFTPDLLEDITRRGCETAFITLHVGAGTFAPVRDGRLSDHVMHSERYEVSDLAAERIARARADGRPVLAVGTTVVRTLESVAATLGEVAPHSGSTSIFIREGHRFRVVDQLMTNFHLPASTLIVLVSAFAGRETVLGAYAHAVAQRYRFFSYGDGMLLR